MDTRPSNGQDRFIQSLDLCIDPRRDRAWDWEAARRECLAIAYRLTSHAADAEDMAQEALLRAWRMRRACRSPDPTPWIRQIARNETLRAVARRPTHTALDAVAEEGVPDAAVETLPDRLDLGAALRDLDPLDRRLIALRYRADLKQAEIAKLLGLPEGTVKVRLHRARRALAEGLDGR